jgi:hypothetical protein
VSALSQAVITPLAEEFIAKKAAQGAGKRLEDHTVFLDIRTWSYIFYHRSDGVARVFKVAGSR